MQTDFTLVSGSEWQPFLTLQLSSTRKRNSISELIFLCGGKTKGAGRQSLLEDTVDEEYTTKGLAALPQARQLGKPWPHPWRQWSNPYFNE
jgi:hypothetical protein